MNPTKETFAQIWEQVRKSPGNGLPPELQKAITQATGLVWYDLEPYAKLLFPVLTPLRNRIPRVPADGGTATHWISITGVNITNVDLGLGEGQRGGTVTTQVQNNVATYASFGLDDSVTFQADLAAKNLDDAKALAVDNLLKATMIGEEKMIVGSNSSLALGTAATPTLNASSSGGTLGSITLSVIVVALSFDGFNYAGGVTPAPTAANIIRGLVTRTNTDGSVAQYGGGSGQKSAAATASITGPNGSCQASTTAVKGASGYAWFWGLAGAETLGAITSINSVNITANATGTQTAASLPAADNSRNQLQFDGVITQICTSGSNSYYNALATGTPGTGTTLTTDGAGGIVEIDAALKQFWDNYRLGPQVMLVNSQELRTITKISIAGGGAPLFRFYGDMQGKDSAAGISLTAGTVVGNYLNKYTMSGGQLVQVLLHPNVPPGMIIFWSNDLPYPMSNVRNLMQMKMRRDYFQIEWPQTRPAYEYSVWADGLLQNYFPPAFGVISNIAPSS